MNKIGITINDNNITFFVANPRSANGVVTETYDINKSISVAANLREAFNSSAIMGKDLSEALIIIDSLIMLVPIEEKQNDLEALFRHTFQSSNRPVIIATDVIEELNAIAVFSVDKDVNTVINDHFKKIIFTPAGKEVWLEMRKQETLGTKTLFANFRYDKMEVFCFHHNRFGYFNTFNTVHAQDALYYIMSVWKQLAMDPLHDQLYIIGEPAQEEWLIQQLQQYIKHAHHNR